MVLETWSETERIQLSKIENDIILPMIRAGCGGDLIYEQILLCILWTSTRVVVFAAILAGGLYKSSKIEKEAADRFTESRLFNERIERLLKDLEQIPDKV